MVGVAVGVENKAMLLQPVRARQPTRIPNRIREG
jgi:hypothetical protein